MELWKTIKGHTDYSISTLGKIVSRKRDEGLGILLKPYPTPKGYLLIDLDNKTYTVHRLVLKTFKPTRGAHKLQANHKDMDKRNNTLANLEWCTNLENQIHSWGNGRKAANGSKQGNSVLVEEEVMEIIQLLKDGKLSQRLIAEKYGVCKSTIGKINTKKNWSHLWN
jgi:predicted XRE-type DNA-binding protein